MLSVEVGAAHSTDVYMKLKALGFGPLQRKKGRQALPMLAHPDGTHAQTATEAQEIWRDFATGLEFGETVTTQELWNTCVEQQLMTQQQGIEPPFAALPSQGDLERFCKRVKFRKATGPDGLVSEIYHVFPAQIATITMPLLTKMYIRCMEPLQCKGGTLIRAWKGKGSMVEPASYRGLLISNHLSKVLHASCRALLMPLYHERASKMQLGGRRGAVVTHAGHHVRALLSMAKQQKKSAAILFLDIKTAFYRVLRPLVAKLPTTHMQLQALLERFNLPASAIDDLVRELNEASMLREAGASQHAETLVAEIHQSTWFATPGLPKVTRTTAGSRPGDPYADVVFNFLFIRVLNALRPQLEELGVLFSLEWSGIPSIHPWQHPTCSTESIFEAVWADDLAILLMDADAAILVEKTTTAATMLIDVCVSFGLMPNMDPGKTEVILALYGKGSTKVRREIFAEPHPHLTLATQHLGQIHLRIVQRYQHLGSEVTHVGNDHAEMRTRMARARQAFKQYRTRVFQSPHVSLERRCALFLPLISSIFQFALGTWSRYNQRTWLSIQQQLVNLYKALLAGLFPRDQIQQMSQEEVISRTQLPALDTLLHVNRLRHFAQLLREGPSPLWAILQHERTWLESCASSFAWLYDQLRSTIPFHPPMDDWPTWEVFLCQAPQRWKGWLARAQLHATLQTAKNWGVKIWHDRILKTLQPLGLCQFSHQDEQQVESESPHLCAPCGQFFQSYSAWSVHAFRKHQRVNHLRRLIQGSTCQSCAREYWTPIKLHHHLKYKKDCREYYFQHVRHGDILPGTNSKFARESYTVTQCPPIDAAVPLAPPGRYYWVDPESEPCVTILHSLEALLAIRSPVESTPGGCQFRADRAEDIRKIFVQAPIPFTQMRVTWKAFLIQWRLLTPESFSEDEDETWVEILIEVDQQFSPSWLIPQTHSNQHDKPSHEAYHWLLGLDETPVLELLSPAPPRAPRELFILHFFSGRRRQGDLQGALESMPWKPGVLTHVLSLDLVFGEQADLSTPWARRTWLGLFQDNLIWGFFAGPPCESWSRARHVKARDIKVRPLRSNKEPWGFESTSVREVRQLLMANLLMSFVLLCYAWQTINGRFGLVEHPQTPDDPLLASIWRTKLWKVLAQANTLTVDIAQGYFGAPSSKPTKLAITPRLHWAAESLRQHHVRNYLPQNASIGKNESGEFKTAMLKEYPPALNQGLARLLFDWTDVLEPCPTVQPIPDTLRNLCKAFVINGDHAMGMDYVEQKCKIIQVA